jgi:hypothetical protein
MVKSIQDLFGRRFEKTKIDHHSAFIQGLRFHRHLHGEVMTVERLTFSPYFSEVVGSGKIGFNSDFIHNLEFQYYAGR